MRREKTIKQQIVRIMQKWNGNWKGLKALNLELGRAGNTLKVRKVLRSMRKQGIVSLVKRNNTTHYFNLEYILH